VTTKKIDGVSYYIPQPSVCYWQEAHNSDPQISTDNEVH